ncbi:MAG: hypothetical protein IJ545_05440 [Alphaproteobacteria bacterium]|nr:hypothetical protein [Alphaproteobacteria bacterium]
MSKKEQKTVETAEDAKQGKTSFSILLMIKSLLSKLILIGLIGGGAYWLYLNPQVLQRFDQKNESHQENDSEALILQINQLQNQVAVLQSQILERTEPDMSGFEEKVERLEKQNLNVIDSKADAAIVLGMLTRVDKLENRLDKLAKISDDGALILSAAMLVKQAAEEGGNFVYEAEILNQLTPKESTIQKDVSLIEEYARNGVSSKANLIQQFKTIYEKTHQPSEETAQNWKERFNAKLNEYIKVSKKGEKEQVEENTDDLAKVASFVFDGQIKKAVLLIESSESDAIKQNQSLQEWLVDAQNMLSFKQAIRNIAAYSLAEMKVNNLKNKE